MALDKSMEKSDSHPNVKNRSERSEAKKCGEIKEKLDLKKNPERHKSHI